MATLREDDDDDRNDPLESDQDPGDDDGDDADEAETPCPYCGEPVYEQAELCPHCRSYISREDAPRVPGQARVPAWIWLGVALVMAAVVTWVLKNI